MQHGTLKHHEDQKNYTHTEVYKYWNDKGQLVDLDGNVYAIKKQ